ncbi:aminotransferase class V-fold PLP-dependent enzyme [Olsenella phocaeensis]|uniref:aminotransferase class V-fold PLP-dependent enzyme n=1 Tax=Olsenella phocaeensis TaxID=1852385 RepID=UPI003A8FDC59
MIYLDNAATTMRKPQVVVDAVVEALQGMGNASRGTSEASLVATRADYVARERLARLFGCPRADHVAFCSNSTEALNLALMGLVRPEDHVVSTDLEHNSVLRPLYRLRDERGVRLDFAGADGEGRLDYDALERLVVDGTRLVAVTHGSNVTGNMVDVRRVADVAHAHGALVVLDASQTAGAHDVDMGRLGADVVCFTGHKGLMGPQGTGGLCLAEGVDVAPLKVGGTGVKSFLESQPDEYPTRLEAGTLNNHGIAGLSAALGWLEELGVEVVRTREGLLMRRFWEGVRSVDGVRVYGDFGQAERCAIVALNVRDHSSSAVSDELSQRWGIATRPGAHCAPRMHRALGTVEQGVVRFSFSYFNTEDEVDVAIAAVRELAA